VRGWNHVPSMGARDLPDSVCRLISECIGSATELEILLLLHGAPGQAWTAAAVDGRLRVGVDRAAADLSRLAATGLVKEGEDGYRFAPRTPAVRHAVDDLDDAYARRRVRVIDYLYSRGSSDAITLFSDAFRFRRKEE
jgi:23S rRNA C2498 (ribose-2'-O)-methylase RlmM